jgi:electron transfer flavoprotein beta subunit
MRIVVPIKQTPDLVEELDLNDDETDVDREFLKFVVSEWDDKALEEAMLLKEAAGGEVIVVGFGDPDIELTLYTALAKGADRAVNLTGIGEGWIDNHTRAAVLADWLAGQEIDLVLAGVQAVDDLDGQLPPLLASRLDWPHAGVVIGVDGKDNSVVAYQEFGGGKATHVELKLPAVVGVQSSRQPPRYASITRIRQAQQAGGIEEATAGKVDVDAGITVRRLFEPEKSGHAEMLTGSPEDVADRILELIRSKGVLK